MSVLVRITRLTLRHKWILAGVYVSMIGGTAASLALPKLFGSAIDEAAAILDGATYSQEAVLWIAGGIIAAATIQGILGFGQSYLAEALGEATVYDIRNQYYDKVQNLSFGFHDKQHTGNLMSRAINDVESMRVFIHMGLVMAPYVLGLFVVVALLLVRLDWRLGLIAGSLMPVVGILSIYVRVKLRSAWLSFMEHMGFLATVLQENLSGVKVVRAFAIEDFEERKYDKWNSKVRADVSRAIRWEVGYGTLIKLSYWTIMGVILWYGGSLVARGELTPGELGQFFFYLQILIMPVWHIGGVITSIARATPAGQRLFEIMDTPSQVVEAVDGVELTRVEGHVRFENVGFAYMGGKPVLQNIEIDATPGKVIALVGPPGSGKSSIVNLIPRFYDVEYGTLRIDGTDIRKVSLKSLRRNIGIVQQDTFAFTATIAENIAYGQETAPREQIVEAAKVAQLHEFITTLDEGYDTMLAERGANLSGGQRQRLSIARAVLLNPPILILDDSTASVDAHTEEQIRIAMESVMKGRTTFVIANRLSTVHKADEILVMNDGRIVERGVHKDLLEMGGRYRQIYDLQLRPQEQVLREFDVPVQEPALVEESI